MLNEMSEKKSTVWYHLYVKSKKYNKLNNLNKNKKTSRLTDKENKLVFTSEERAEARSTEAGISKRVIMGLYEIRCVKLSKSLKLYRI